MTIMLIIYAVVLLIVLGYTGVNVFHVFRFRLPNDKSYLAMTMYLFIVISIIATSIVAATITSQI